MGVEGTPYKCQNRPCWMKTSRSKYMFIIHLVWLMPRMQARYWDWRRLFLCTVKQAPRAHFCWLEYMLAILSSVGQTIRKLISLSNRWRAFNMSDLAYRVIIWEWKSTSGVVFFLGSNLVTWTSPKQRVVALSVLLCSWIYIAASAGACQRCTGGEVKMFKLFTDRQQVCTEGS